MVYQVYIYCFAAKESKPILIEQPDRTNLASNPQIPKGWMFMHAEEYNSNE